MEIVLHSQRELVAYEGNLTSYHFIFSFKACFTKLLNDFFASVFRYRRYNLIENISSYVQCKSLNALSVYFFFDALSCQNYFFQGVCGGVQKSSGNSGGAGSYFSGQKLEILGRRDFADLLEIRGSATARNIRSPDLSLLMMTLTVLNLAVCRTPVTYQLS